METNNSVEDCFMTKFKYYKSNKIKPSFENVIFVEKSVDTVFNYPIKHTTNDLTDLRAECLGLKSLTEWHMFAFKKHPGLLFIKNPFTTIGQRYWIRKCLEQYPVKPNKLNIDIEMNVQDWWSECYRNSKTDKQLLKKLRWTTLGYHHNWDTKIYKEENKSKFPEDLAELSDVFANYLGYDSFKAEAAIINYYHMNSTLSAHTDHSEVNLEAPLFSYSFGQSAIFLIGGKDKTTDPSAILINSGDVIVMSKEARLCYHAVPKILPATNSPWNEIKDDMATSFSIILPSFKYISQPEKLLSCMKENADDESWHMFRDYIQEARINMNVRQVLNENQCCL